MLNKGDLIVHRWADFLEDFVICKVLSVKPIEKYSEDWYLYSGAIFDFSKDCTIIQSEIIYSSDNKWKRGLTLYISEDEAMEISDYLNFKPTWDDYLKFKSEYDDIF